MFRAVSLNKRGPRFANAASIDQCVLPHDNLAFIRIDMQNDTHIAIQQMEQVPSIMKTVRRFVSFHPSYTNGKIWNGADCPLMQRFDVHFLYSIVILGAKQMLSKA
jgi:hypothetical protein